MPPRNPPRKKKPRIPKTASRIPVHKKANQVIADDLRQAIASGQFQPGDRLPAEFALADTYGVHQLTARSAMRILEMEGLVVARPKQGRFVRDVKVIRWQMNRRDSAAAAKTTAIDPWIYAVTEAGYKGHQTIEVKTVSADTPIMADTLGGMFAPGSGEQAVCRARVRTIDGEPSELANSYYPYTVARDTPIMFPDDIQPGIFPLLAEMGYELHHHEDALHPRMPTKGETAQLELPPSTPVLEMVRRTFFTHPRMDGPGCLLVRHSVYAHAIFLYEVGA